VSFSCMNLLYVPNIEMYSRVGFRSVHEFGICKENAGIFLMYCHHIVNKTDTGCAQSKMGMAYILNQNRHGTDMDTTGNGGVPWQCTHLPPGYSHYISSCHKYQHDVTGRRQTRPFEERI